MAIIVAVILRGSIVVRGPWGERVLSFISTRRLPNSFLLQPTSTISQFYSLALSINYIRQFSISASFQGYFL
jgi:hypothetical protein